MTWEQRAMLGDPKFEASQDIPDFPYDTYAESLGLVGLRMETKADVERVWREALAARRPVVINAYTDPEVPTLPPHISFEQARHFTEAILHRDPKRGRHDEAGSQGRVRRRQGEGDLMTAARPAPILPPALGLNCAAGRGLGGAVMSAIMWMARNLMGMDVVRPGAPPTRGRARLGP